MRTELERPEVKTPASPTSPVMGFPKAAEPGISGTPPALDMPGPHLP